MDHASFFSEATLFEIGVYLALSPAGQSEAVSECDLTRGRNDVRRSRNDRLFTPITVGFKFRNFPLQFLLNCIACL